MVSLSKDTLRSFSQGLVGDAQSGVHFHLPEPCSLLWHRQIDRRLVMIERDPSQHPWMYRAIVRRKDAQMVGYISYHHKAPDPDLVEYAAIGAELGYTVEREYRRMGYARESAIGMMEWAHRDFGVTDFILTISPDNHPSLKMAESMKFEIVGSHDDPVDGMEYVMKADIDDILKPKNG